jgi:hypothetical protein
VCISLPATSPLFGESSISADAFHCSESNGSRRWICSASFTKDSKPYPWVSAVAGTNYCHIGLDIDEERNSIAVMSVLDSVGKGGAHVAIENLNVMAGFNRTDALHDRGMHP